jgi:flagellin-like hook-associated protein FlgL
MSISSIGANSVGSVSSILIQSLTNTTNQLNTLQAELGTGQAATTYSGLGAQSGLTVQLDAQLAALTGYGDTITNVGNNISIAQTALTQIGSVAANVRQAAVQSVAFAVGNTGQTTTQQTAGTQLDAILSALNTQAGNSYLFSGTAVNTPSVATSDQILNGNGAQAGLKQVIAERNQADLGANGLGRLVIPTAGTGPATVIGTGATLAPDQATGTGTVGALTSATTLASLGVQQGDVITISDGVNQTSYTAGPGATIGSLMAGLSNQPGGANVTVTLVNGELQLQSGDSTSTISISDNNATPGTDIGALGFGTGNTSFAPNTLISQGAVTAGQTLTLAVGSNTALTITFGTGAGQVSTLAGLNQALQTLAGGTASVDPQHGDLDVTASSSNNSINIGGTANLSEFGVAASTTPPAGVVTVSEDAAGSPFGFKLASISSSLTGATVSGPSGSPAGIAIDLDSNPDPGDSITFTLNLPDGTTTSLALQATTSSPPGTNQFAIGGTPAATAANLQAALTTSVKTLAATQLSAASAMEAGQNFFGNPPLRVDGPPFATATTLTDGTSANTFSWYTGENGSTPALQTAVAQVGQSSTVSYGMRANEPALSSTVAAVAVLAAVTYSPSDPNAAVSYSALTQRVSTALNGTPGTQSISDIEASLAVAQTTITTAQSNNSQVQTTLTNMLQQIEGVNQDQVGSEILQLQTNLEASMSTTARMAQISLVNYLPA